MDRSLTSTSFLLLSYLIVWVLFSYSEKALFAVFPYFMKALKTEEEYWIRPLPFSPGSRTLQASAVFSQLSASLICEQRFKRLKRGKLVQYFRHNETFLLSLYFPAVLICGYSPSPQRSPGNPKSDSLWSDTWTQTFLPINYISCVIKQNWLLWSLETCFRLHWATSSFAGSHTSWLRGSPWPILAWEQELWVHFADRTMLECFLPCPFTSTMCHSLPPKHLIYSNSLAWPVIPLSLPPDPSVFHFPLVSVQRARPRPCLEPLDRDWPSSLFLHHILRWKKKKKMTIRSENRACFVPCSGDLEAFSIICTPYSLKRINVINIGPVVGIFSSK